MVLLDEITHKKAEMLLNPPPTPFQSCFLVHKNLAPYFSQQSNIVRGEGDVKLAMCSSRKYPYLYHGGFLLLYPHPLGMSIPRGDCKTPPHPLGFP